MTFPDDFRCAKAIKKFCNSSLQNTYKISKLAAGSCR